MTDDVNDLIKRLKKQAKLYDEIDAGTKYGWDMDAYNIREAIQILSTFQRAWRELEQQVRLRCEDTESYKTGSKQAMALKLEANILGDMRVLSNLIMGGDGIINDGTDDL